MLTSRLLARSGRLRFENDIMCRLGVPMPSVRPKRPFRTVARMILAAFCSTFLVLTTAWGASGFFNASGKGSDKKALAELATILTEALRTGELNQAASFTVDDEAARQQLGESAGGFLETVQAGAKSGTLKQQTSCQLLLAALRNRLSKQGLAWERIRPLGFGGLVASVSTTDSKGHDKAQAFLGEVYFESSGTVYALELTARKCGRKYVVMDFWGCSPTPARADAVEKYSLGRFQALGQEPDPKGLPVNVKDLRSLFAPTSP